MKPEVFVEILLKEGNWPDVPSIFSPMMWTEKFTLVDVDTFKVVSPFRVREYMLHNGTVSGTGRYSDVIWPGEEFTATKQPNGKYVFNVEFKRE